MKTLKEEVQSIPQPIKELIEKRLEEFSSFLFKEEDEWFSELCFCILTANSKAKTALEVQNQLSHSGFIKHKESQIVKAIKNNKHRFHNNKARYIVEARKHIPIKSKIHQIIQEKDSFHAREWLVKNVKGLGYKEASHFLRNTGHEDLAILDRHILNKLHEIEIINKIPKPLTRAQYLEIESKFNKIAFLFDMTPSKLDLYMWYLKTGEVLK